MTDNMFMVSYDVADDGRRRAVHDTCLAYGDRLQYSVFCCLLSPVNRLELMARLRDLIHHHEDQVLLIDLGPAQGRAKRCLTAIGRPTAAPNKDPTIL